MAIFKLALNQKYKPKIMGLGEVYEAISVERKKKSLAQKFKGGVLFLSPNQHHQGKGLTLEELKRKVSRQGYQILESGFLDSPPWPSRPRRAGENSFLNHPLLTVFFKLIFSLLVTLEPLWQGPKRSHMIYVLGRKRRARG